MKRSKKNLPYSEGDWFAVPLQPTGYGIGLIARAPGNGVVLGYFFRSRRQDAPKDESTLGQACASAMLIARFGDTGLVQKHWPTLFHASHWSRDAWPLPSFGRILELEGRKIAWRIEYSDADLVTAIRETRTNPGQIQQLPEDSMWGHLALEEYLSKLLSE